MVCSPGTMWPGEWPNSTSEPDGSVPYYCQSDTTVWNIEPGDTFVRPEEPDGDWVFNTFHAAWYLGEIKDGLSDAADAAGGKGSRRTSPESPSQA